MQTTQQTVSPEDLYEVRIPLNPQLNPAGDKAVYIVKDVDREEKKYRTRLHLIDIKRRTDIEYTRGRADSSPRWHPSGKKILYLNNDNKDNTLRTISIFGGESRDLMSLGKGDVSDLTWSPDGKYISFLMAQRPQNENGDDSDEPVFRLVDRLHYRSDGEGWKTGAQTAVCILKTGSDKPLFIRPSHGHAVTCYAWAPDSRSIAFVSNPAEDPDRDINNDRIYIHSLEKDSAREVTDMHAYIDSVFFGNDGSHVYFNGHLNRSCAWGASNIVMHRVNLKTGNVDCLNDKLDRTMEGCSLGDLSPSFEKQVPVFDENGNIYFTVSSEGGSPLYKLSPDGSTEVVLEGPEVIVEFHKAASAPVFILNLAQMERPAEIWLMDISGDKSLTRLTRLNDAFVEKRRFAFPEVHTVPVDGAMIQSWIIKPPDFREGRKYPMILQIHGGPRGQYAYNWFHEMHTLAAAGFVVVYSNPQGSQGYGYEFADSISGRWGEPAFSDLMTLTDYMIASGYIDEEKLFVTGGSYGGYMINWIVTHTDRFRAAATQRSVWNLESFFFGSDYGWLLGFEFGGAPWENPDAYRKWSPSTYAGDIRTPLLIIHSEQDLRCPVNESEQIFTRLKYEGKPVKFIRYPEESHGLSRGGRPDRRVHRLNSLIDWFKSFL